MTPKLQQLLDSLAARNVQKIRLTEGQSAQIWKNGAWNGASLQVTSELLDALALENGARELQTASANFRAEVETSGAARQITLTNLGVTIAQLKATTLAPTAAPLSVPPPHAPAPRAGIVAGDVAGDAKIANDKVGDFKAAQRDTARNLGALAGDLKSVPLPAVAVAVEPVAPAKQQWFYANDGEQHGPKPRMTMQALIMGGTIGRDTMLWREGLPEWIMASDSEFSASLPAAVPVQIVPRAPQQSVPEYRDLGLDFGKGFDRDKKRFRIIRAIIAIGVVASLSLDLACLISEVRI